MANTNKRIFGSHIFKQIQIFLGWEYEYNYDYFDWYSQKKITIFSHTHTHTQNRYVYGYKSYKSMQVKSHMCHNISFLVLGLKKWVKIKRNYDFVKKKFMDANMNLFRLTQRENTNANIFGWQKKANTNSNIRTGIPKYEYEYLSHTR